MNAPLIANAKAWQRGYHAPNVESWVFRWSGRILRDKLGITGGTVLDWGCGAGAAVRHFADNGFDAYGVDVSEPDIAVARRIVDPAHVRVVDAKPDERPFFPSVQFDVVVSIQSLYYLTNDDFGVLMASLRRQMKPGAILYVTMMGTQCWYYRNSVPAENGMRRIVAETNRWRADTCINFVADTSDLVSRFKDFEPLLIGYYENEWGEGPEFHYTFTGRLR